MRSPLFALLVASPLAAQAPVRLDRPDAEFAEGFSNIVGLRELPNGRVIISDRLEQMVALLDFASGSMTPIGRQGNGPGEFGAPGQLFPWTGDTTLMLDFTNRRGMLIAANGSVSTNTVQFDGNGSIVIPRFVDNRGRLYAQAPMFFGGGGPATMPDSMPIVRWALGGTMDTLFRVPVGGGGIQIARAVQGAGGVTFGGGGGRRRAFVPSMAWAVTPDGRVVQVHPEPYHVRVLGAGQGPTVTYQPVRITQRDREAWADAQTQGQITMRGPQGSQTMRPPRPNLDDVDFPEFKPPFEAVLATPDGEVWVRLSRAATATRQLYDVFNAQGQRVRQVELADGRRLVGFGDGTLYAVRVDEDDLQWLERYRR